MRTPHSSRFRGLVTTSALGAMMFGVGFIASTPAMASDTQDAYKAHHWECVGLLLSDSDAHAASCLPSRIVPSLGSTSKSGSAAEEKCVPHTKKRGPKKRRGGPNAPVQFSTLVVVEGPSDTCHESKNHKPKRHKPRKPRFPHGGQFPPSSN